jgi:hypothetical protein
MTFYREGLDPVVILENTYRPSEEDLAVLSVGGKALSVSPDRQSRQNPLSSSTSVTGSAYEPVGGGGTGGQSAGPSNATENLSSTTRRLRAPPSAAARAVAFGGAEGVRKPWYEREYHHSGPDPEADIEAAVKGMCLCDL